MDKYEEEALARKKKESIEFRNKKRNSNLFLFFGCVFEIIETVILIFGLFLLFSLLFFKVFNMQSQTVFSVGSLVIFFGGLFLGFQIYKFTVRWVIAKFNLEEKLTKEVLDHYLKISKEEIEQAKRR